MSSDRNSPLLQVKADANMDPEYLLIYGPIKNWVSQLSLDGSVTTLGAQVRQLIFLTFQAL